MIRLLFFSGCMMIPMMVKAQHDPLDPFDWRSEIDTILLDGDALPEFDWNTWRDKDWEEKFREDYQHYYKQKEANKILNQAYQYAGEQNVNLPQRFEGDTYDPEQEQVYVEDEAAYIDRLDAWVENMEDGLTETGLNMALDMLYIELEPILKALKERNAVLLDKILPDMGGIPAYDPVEDKMKENREGKKNFQYWVKLAAENVMENLFKKNAEGKYELQREKVELLKQVGIIRFLKMSAMDWEIMQSLALEVPDEILSYAQALQDVYQSGEATFQAGKELYRQVNTLDTELHIPKQFDQFKELTIDMATNRLTMMEMVNKRKKVLALTYRKLAQRYRQYGEELNQKLKEKNQLKMKDAERIKALQIANDYLDESMRLQAKAEQLLTSTTTATKDQYLWQHEDFKRISEFYGNQ